MAMAADGTIVMLPHKCGTSYVTRVLTATFPDAHLIAEDRHLPMSRLQPQDFTDFRVIGLVRNPFEWYVSRWFYLTQTAKYHVPPFAAALWRDIYNPHGIFGRLPDDHPEPPEGIGSFTWQHVMYHSRRYAEVCSETPQTLSGWLDVKEVLRVEDLREGLVRVYGDAVRPHLNQWRNSYPHGPYRNYYTGNLVNLVKQADRIVLEKYGYQF